MTAVRPGRRTPGPPPAFRSYDYVGLVIGSDIALPYLTRCPPAKAQISVYRRDAVRDEGAKTIFEMEDAAGDVVFTLSLGEGGYQWTYPQTGTFTISRDGSLVGWRAEGNQSDAGALLSGPILNFALQLQGRMSLHGDVLVKGETAFGLLAPSGFGKSTLAAACLAKGCAMLADDLLTLDTQNARAAVFPGVARLKLWPDSLERRLPLLAPAQSKFVSWLDKRVVDPRLLGGACARSMPLGALFVLYPQPPEAAVELVRLQGKDALITLIGLGYQAHLLTEEKDLLLARMDYFQALAVSVPLYAVAGPRSYDRLDETADAVLAMVGDLG